MKLVKIGAEWCGPCKTMDARLKTFTTCPVEYVDADDDTNAELIENYKVRNIPVIILLNDKDEEVKRWNGIVALKDIDAAIAELA